jgi:hypothetical protein
MIIELWIFFAVISFLLFILSCLYRMFENEMLIYGWIATGMFFILGITSQAIEKNYCELDSSDAWSCKTLVIKETGTGLMFYGLALISLVLMIIFSIYRPLEVIQRDLDDRLN